MVAHAQQLGGVHEQKLQEGSGEVSKRFVYKFPYLTSNFATKIQLVYKYYIDSVKCWYKTVTKTT